MPNLKTAVVSLLPKAVASRLRAAKRAAQNPNWIDETELIARMAADGNRGRQSGRDRVLVDVGANYGAVTARFVEMGWSAVAYEPDPANRAQFERRIGSNSRVQLSSDAVSDTPADSVSLFTSPISIGISTLTPFHQSHEATATVKVVTLSDDLHRRGIRHVDFLKVDIEGFDYFALRGFDWNYAPRFVLYEFEDRKTLPLGHSLSISSTYMRDRGYDLVYSVWEPIVEYGAFHTWRGLFTTPPPDVDACWGNVLCFRLEADANYCTHKYGHRWRRTLDDIRYGVDP